MNSRRFLIVQDKTIDNERLRNKVLGLGEKSFKKNYYSELQSRADELERFRILLDQVNVGIIICQVPHGKIVDSNESARFHLLKSNELNSEDNIVNYFGQSFIDEMRELYRLSQRSEHPEYFLHNLEMSLNRHDYEVSIGFKKINNESFATLFFHDISIQKTIENTLKENKKYLRNIIDLISDAIIIQDADTFVILDFNKSVSHIFHYQEDEILKKQITDFFINKEQYLKKDLFIKFLQAKENGFQSFEWKAKNKEHQEFWVEINIRYSDDNGSRLLITLIRDINERKAEEENKLKMEQQLLHTQKLESLGVLAGGIAHDFNNILTAILGHSELATLKLNDKDQVFMHLSEIKKASQRASDLSQQMLAYSGKGKFIKEPINFNNIISEMIDLLKVSISKKVQLNLHLEENLPLFEGGVSQIRQVVMNLITNASEAIGDQEGEIAIHTGTQVLNEIDDQMMYLNQDVPFGLCVYFEIRDNGCGMDKDTLQKIFDPFFTTKFTGRGLGMSAILGIIRGHHGMIHVYSELGLGTRFKVFFPAIGQTADDHEEKTFISNNVSILGKVLIVDDETTILDVAEQYLMSYGVETIKASNGIEAVKVYSEHKDELSLILLDLTMPGMSGEEVFNTLHSYNNSIPIILMSGFSEYELKNKYSSKGFSGFIQKPFSFADFQEKINKVFKH